MYNEYNKKRCTKIMKRIIQYLLIISMCFTLFGCENTGDLEVQEKFDAYLDELIKEELESDYLSYHYMIVDGNHLDIHKPEVSLGSLTLDSSLESIESSKEELKELQTFDLKELTTSQQEIYTLLEIQLKENIEYEKYLNFDYCFGDNQVNDNLITNFTEYRFDDKEDILDFVTLLEDSGRYIDEGIQRTLELSKNGFVQNEWIKETVIESCEKFIQSEEIEKNFSAQIKNMNLTTDETKEYEEQVKNAVDTIMQPAYQRIVDCYKGLPKSKYQGSLSEMKNGKEYFEYLLRVKVGSDRSAEDWIEIMDSEVEDTLMKWVMVMITNENIEEEVENVQLPKNNAYELVQYLENCIDSEFPKIEKVDYRVNYLDASVASDLVSAYYVVPPIDAPSKNVIKVNPNNTDLVSLFSTLAHEGFPGHLYQNNYAVQQKQPLIYRFLDRLGSSEGWAEYVGMDSYRIADIGSKAFQEYMKQYNYLNMILVEYIDLRVNYSGWNIEDITAYLEEVGLVSDIAENLYENVIKNPAVYAPYSLGTYEVLNLREKAELKLKDKFDPISFNQALLDAGTVHFNIIEKKIDDYIKNK